MSRAANALLGTDLLLIATDVDQASLAQAWFYVPRLLHDRSVVMQEISSAEGESRYQALTHELVDQLARAVDRRKAA